MSTDTSSPQYQKPVIEFKSTSFSVPVLTIYSTEIKQIDLQLKEKIAQAPDFFKDSPLLIDLHDDDESTHTIDLHDLLTCLRKNKLFPIGISGANDKQQKQAYEQHILPHTLRSTHPVVPSAQKIATNEELPVAPSPQENTSTTAIEIIENKLITQPVRSGQRIYAKGDLTILAQVSAGAEVMAEGSIHVYGTLKGRALAGVQGDITCRIFCSKLEAELISIAGHYKISEDIDESNDQPTQIFLQEQALIIKTL